MSAEDYLPEGWEVELADIHSTDFLSGTEGKTRINEDKMSSIEEILCPECNGKMVSRKGKFGVFWGCVNYPSCKGTRDNMGRSKADRAKERGELYEPDDNDETNKYSFKRTR